MMIIRAVETSDVVELKRLLNQLVETNAPILELKEIVKRVQSTKSYNLFGMFDKDHMVATVSLIKGFDVTGDGSDFYILENFVVDESYRMRGYGRQLLDYVESYIRSQNGRSVIFTSSCKRPDAHSFYYKNGYEKDFVKGFKKYFT